MVVYGTHAHTFETSAPSPRVNAQQASQNVGRRVLLVGRVLDGGDKIQTADDGVISVNLLGAQGNGGAVGECGPLSTGKVVEISGVMEMPNVINEDARAYLGDSFGTILSLSLFSLFLFSFLSFLRIHDGT